jgi:hypothetical protein
MVRKSTQSKTKRSDRADKLRKHEDSNRRSLKSKTGRTPTASAAERSRGIVANRHPEIRKAGQALIANPTRAEASSKLVATIADAVRIDARPRRRGQHVNVAKRVGALLRAYCPQLPRDVAIRIRMQANAQLAPIAAQLLNAVDALYVPERMAALRLGVTVADLRDMCCEMETRRRLGWPRPIATRILFRTAALDPSEAGEFLASLPAQEPWPLSSWPEGWRS